MRAALLLYLAWTLATFLLEGWLRTLVRPDAVGTRIAYGVVANVLLGTVGAGLVLKKLVAELPVTEAGAGFGPSRRTLLAVPAGAVMGAALYVLQRGPSMDPIVLLNLYAQTLNVTIAEVLVCWAVVGTAWHGAFGGPGQRWASVGAGVAAGVAFGVSHVAHSPPFNTLSMMALLTAVGCLTSLFFFLSRDVYGTVVFHNCLALVGVGGALAATGQLAPHQAVQIPLLALAVVSLGALVGTHVWIVGRGRRRPPSARPGSRMAV